MSVRVPATLSMRARRSPDRASSKTRGGSRRRSARRHDGNLRDQPGDARLRVQDRDGRLPDRDPVPDSDRPPAELAAVHADQPSTLVEVEVIGALFLADADVSPGDSPSAYDDLVAGGGPDGDRRSVESMHFAAPNLLADLEVQHVRPSSFVIVPTLPTVAAQKFTRFLRMCSSRGTLAVSCFESSEFGVTLKGLCHGDAQRKPRREIARGRFRQRRRLAEGRNARRRNLVAGVAITPIFCGT